jgi:putative ABC transport system ATP-binding protein
MEPAVAISMVTKTYSGGKTGFTALRGVSLEVHGGEMVMLMGPSGSGKTTLLSIVGCILRATSGSVRVAGREVGGLSEGELPQIRLQHIGFVFQGFNLFPTLTAGENVELTLELKGLNKAEQRLRASDLLDRVGLGDKYKSFPMDLSGGEKQRVAIARALAGDPEILLADEPTAALDSHTGRTVMEIMQALARKHSRAVVVVTHDSRMLDLADRVLKMEDGLIVDSGLQPSKPNFIPGVV